MPRCDSRFLDLSAGKDGVEAHRTTIPLRRHLGGHCKYNREMCDERGLVTDPDMRNRGAYQQYSCVELDAHGESLRAGSDTVKDGVGSRISVIADSR
jgi:hypothetical protein